MSDNTFYTNVSRFGNQLLVRGFKNGIRFKEKVKFKPTLYIPSDKGKFRSLDGRIVADVKFDSMRDAKDFEAQYKDLESFEIYGNKNYVAQYIQEQYPGNINFNSSLINSTKLDIEVKSDSGFPEPSLAEHPVTAICIKNNIDNVHYLWACKEFDVKAAMAKFPDREIEFIYCEDEIELLKQFLCHWATPANTPDVITGWNTEGFDIPYLCNRILRLLDEDHLKMLSPWGKIQKKNRTFHGQDIEEWVITGIAHLDYLPVFKKFTVNTLGAQESYKLDHIAYVVLGDRKLSYEEYSSLDDLYNKNPQLYYEYNIHDTALIDRLEDKLGLIELIYTMAYSSGCNYSDTLGTVGIWDTIIYRFLDDRDVVLQPNRTSIKGAFPGGYVKDPQVGMHDWVVSFDLASLYPHIMMQFNVSPETIIAESNVNISVNNVLNNTQEIIKDYANAANGSLYRKDFKGVIPSIIEKKYAERKVIKKEMLVKENELQKVEAELLKRGL